MSRRRSTATATQLPLRSPQTSLSEGITYFVLVINAFLICDLDFQDRLYLCLCHADAVLVSLLHHEHTLLTPRPCHQSASLGGSMSDAKTEVRGKNQLKS